MMPKVTPPEGATLGQVLGLVIVAVWRHLDRPPRYIAFTYTGENGRAVHHELCFN